MTKAKYLAYSFIEKTRRERTARNLRKKGYKVIVKGTYILTNASGITVHQAQAE